MHLNSFPLTSIHMMSYEHNFLLLLFYLSFSLILQWPLHLFVHTQKNDKCSNKSHCITPYLKQVHKISKQQKTFMSVLNRFLVRVFNTSKFVTLGHTW